MTRFSRSGHYRTNHLGTTFWVSGHDVSRDEWPDWAPPRQPGAFTAEDARSTSGNITVPNAICPGCNKPAFFFRDANGGCAYFYSLGKPWPKHECLGASEVPTGAHPDAAALWRWEEARRLELGDQVPDAELFLAKDQAAGAARIVRRSDAVIAIVDAGEEQRAFAVSYTWPGRASRMVYFRRTVAPERPEALDYLLDDLSVASAEVLAEVPVPAAADMRDLATVAEACLPEIEEWIDLNVPAFGRGMRVKVEDKPVGIVGRIGRSRMIALPLVPWFDVLEDDAHGADAAQIALAKRQVESWAGRITRSLDRSGRLPADPVCRDVFVWIIPRTSYSYELDSMLDKMHRKDPVRPVQARGPGVARTRVAHVLQALEDGPEDGVKETLRTFDELTAAERAWLTRTARERRERRWLAAALGELGIDRIMTAFERDGVRFEFLGTIGVDPEAWGQQAILPGDARLLVLLHASNVKDGLAFASFGDEPDDAFASRTVENLFHAKRLSEVLGHWKGASTA